MGIDGNSTVVLAESQSIKILPGAGSSSTTSITSAVSTVSASASSSAQSGAERFHGSFISFWLSAVVAIVVTAGFRFQIS